jgi:guanylate kinase
MRRREPPFPRHYVVTVTTRDRRPQEIPDISYIFLTLDDYRLLERADGLLEASEVHGNWYGTPRDQVRSALSSGKDAILKIDVQGAEKVRAAVEDALLIYVVPPSFEVLRQRLMERRTETAAQLETRLRNAEHELAQQDRYDHVVVNETDQIDRTAERIDAIIAAEHVRFPDRRIEV